jgi:hypothetical protein
MASSLLSLATEVTFTLGNRAEQLPTAKLWVNRSYQRLQDTIEFPESHVAVTFATVVGNPVHALATVAPDLFSIISLRNNTTDKRVRQISLRRYDELALALTGSPIVYTLRGRTSLLLWKVPIAIETLQITYRKRLTPLAVDADLHVLPDAWEEAIVFGATAYGFEANNEIERARQARSSMRATIGQLRDRMAEDLTDRDEAIAPLGLQTGVAP